ncbi:MAG: thiamine phosphate synthase [Thermoanaerobaculia bacterium]
MTRRAVSPKLPLVYAITDRTVSGIQDHVEIARRLVVVGIRWLQVREKELPDGRLLQAVEAIAPFARAHAAILLVNDRVDIARVAGIGVHLGEDDLPPALARGTLGEDAVLGVSTHDEDTARGAFADASADYVAFGPVFASATKPGRPPRGLQELARVAGSKTKPLVAVGGITAENLHSALDAGADAVAMVGALLLGGRLEQNARGVLDRARRRTRLGRIYLVGFMGSGKTAIGRRVAERLEAPFVDLDAEIERTSGQTVRALFEASGEAAFRQRETLFLEGTGSLPDAVVATGGGCYTREENRQAIARLGTAVFLDVPFSRILSRLAGKTDRPLLEGPEQAARLYAEREPFYKMAPVRLPLEEGSIEESADGVLNALFDRTIQTRPL